MTKITKTVDVDTSVEAEVEITIKDIKDFLDECDNIEMEEILQYCKTNIKDNAEDYGIIIKSLNDHYKMEALKEIWDNISIEDMEKLCLKFKMEKLCQHLK